MPEPSVDYAPLRLKKHEERRLQAGHLWVYSNEVNTTVTPLHGFEPGQPVIVQAHNGKPLGIGYINPHSLICARLLSRDFAHPFDCALLIQRLKAALLLRERLYTNNCYRLVYAEGDSLPGLVVDRYGDLYVVQLTTAGMERCKADILQALRTTVKPAAILWRNDSPVRAREGLMRYVEPAFGHMPEEAVVVENNVRFQVPLWQGQKTGWFFDQRDNRQRSIKYARQQRVLDLFSYVGAWGIQAAVHGAREVLCVDSSATALHYLRHNIGLNRVEQRVGWLQDDGLAVLRSLRAAQQRFDVVILDPPAFIKSKKDVKAGVQAYRRLNDMAMQVLAEDGILITSSCSQLLHEETLIQVLSQAARNSQRSLQILEYGQQGPDHPIHPAIPETRYLKTLYARLASL